MASERVRAVAITAALIMILSTTGCSDEQAEAPRPTTDGSAVPPRPGSTEGSGPSATPPASSPSPGSSAGPTNPTPPTPSDFTHEPEPSTPGFSEHEEAARTFGKAWANRSGGSKQWLKRLTPLVSPRVHKEIKKKGVKSAPKGQTSIRCDAVVADAEVKCDVGYEESGERIIWLDWDGSRWVVGALAVPGESI